MQWPCRSYRTNSKDLDTRHGCANRSGASPFLFALTAFLTAGGKMFFSDQQFPLKHVFGSDSAVNIFQQNKSYKGCPRKFKTHQRMKLNLDFHLARYLEINFANFCHDLKTWIFHFCLCVCSVLSLVTINSNVLVTDLFCVLVQTKANLKDTTATMKKKRKTKKKKKQWYGTWSR